MNKDELFEVMQKALSNLLHMSRSPFVCVVSSSKEMERTIRHNLKVTQDYAEHVLNLVKEEDNHEN